MKLSRRSEGPEFLAMDVLAKAKIAEANGRNIIHMEVGEPASAAHALVRSRLSECLNAGQKMGYTQGLGLPELRDGICALYKRRHGIDLDPRRVLVTNGSSQALVLAYLAAFDPGERVAVGDPCYPPYKNTLTAMNLDAVRIETTLETNYHPTPAQLAAVAPLHGLLVGSPANPTGAMLDRPALTALINFCDTNEAIFISDEVYHGLSFDKPSVSALEITDNVIVVNSFSKYQAMTGWRIGWMVVPESMVRTFERLSQNLFICANHVAQLGAIAALQPEAEATFDAHLAVYRRNREIVRNALHAAGFCDIPPIDGGFYAYATLPDEMPDSLAFSAALLDAKGVALAPGVDFDPVRGHRTIRISFAQSTEAIADGMQRICDFVAQTRRAARSVPVDVS